MPLIDTGLGHVSRDSITGVVSIVRSDPLHGVFVHLGLSDEELGAILRLLPGDLPSSHADQRHQDASLASEANPPIGSDT